MIVSFPVHTHLLYEIPSINGNVEWIPIRATLTLIFDIPLAGSIISSKYYDLTICMMGNIKRLIGICT